MSCEEGKGCKLMKQIILTILLFLFLLIPILSQELSENKTKYPHIKELLVAKLNDQAQREIDKLSVDIPNDPTLNYYQTEVWFNKAEEEYKVSNFKKALEYYEKAYQFWSGNPLLSERIRDAKEKIQNPHSQNMLPTQNSNSALFNNSVANGISGLFAGREDLMRIASQGQSNINIIILDKEIQDEMRNQLNGILIENYSKIQKADSISISKPYLVLFSGLGLCLVVANVISLAILFRGKNEIK
jgi:tetratricopeptide (TPR) repeat protein